MAKNQSSNAMQSAVKKTGADEKKEALTTALAQIEKQFGKGAIMKLGDSAALQVEAHFHRQPGAGPGAGGGRRAPRPHHRDLRP